MRNLLALTAFAAIGTVSWLSIAPQNASACDCIVPMIQLELREVTLVDSTRTADEQVLELDTETFRWPEFAEMTEWSFLGEEVNFNLEPVQ